MFYIHGKYHNFILWKDFISFTVPEKQWKWWIYPLPIQSKTQMNPLTAVQTFWNNSFSIKVFPILNLHTEKWKSKRFLVFYVFQFLASIGKSSTVVSEYFNGRPIDRYYIGFTSTGIFIMPHLTSLAISLPLALNLPIPINSFVTEAVII